MEGIVNRKKKWFWALCNELSIDKERAKEKAKRLFKLDSFSHIAEYQLDYLIDQLLKEKDKRGLLPDY